MFHISSFRCCALFLLAFSFIPAFAQQPLRQEALDYAVAHASELGLRPADLEDVAVKGAYLSSKTGVSHIYVNQRHAGIEVYNGVMGLHMDRDGHMVYSTQRFVRNLAEVAQAPAPVQSAAEAIAAAAAYLGLDTAAPRALSEPEGDMLAQRFADAGLSPHDITAALNYYPEDNGAVRLTWNVNLRPAGTEDWWEMLVAADTGKVLYQHNWTVHDAWPAPDAVYADQKQTVEARAAAKGSTNQYRAYDIPVESPNHGPLGLLDNPADPTASPFGWHDTNGVAGAEFTITRGNNVWAYQNRDGFGFSQNDEPDGGANLVFDQAPDFTMEPITYVGPATINLFVWNNFMHDYAHYYGFDEAGGNFQATNYSGNGVGNDFVRAQAQSGANTGSTNNATFGTPPEGSNPTMNMFEWLDPLSRRLEISAPLSIAGSYAGSQANFGPTPPTFPGGVSGDVELVDDQTGTGTDACEPLVGFTPGKIAILDRGSCEFGLKVLQAEQAGAIAAIVVNNVPGATGAMGAGTQGGSVTIPSMMVTMADGQLIKDALALSQTVTVSISADSRVRLDSDYDNGVIAHEYGHGISNRLTGGPGNTSCLGNQEQMGEGWSDFQALAMTTTSANSGTEARGIGTYVSYQPVEGAGIRPWPYSTDMAINPSTYSAIPTVSVPHGVGTVWCTMLWDFYWAMVDRYGFDDDLYHGTGGNNLAIQIVFDGMKMQACSPGFVDGRDGILAADLALTGGANQCLIWEVFARRGVGENASQGNSNVVGDETEDFTEPSTCCEAVTITEQPTGGGVCSGDSFTLTVVANGTENTYQWKRDDVNIPGATSASYTISEVTLATAGNFTCEIVNDCSSNTTVSATVDVISPPNYSTALLPDWNGAPSNPCADIDGNDRFDVTDLVGLIVEM